MTPKPCSCCKRTDWIVSVIIDGKRTCGPCHVGWADMLPAMRAAGVLI